MVSAVAADPAMTAHAVVDAAAKSLTETLTFPGTFDEVDSKPMPESKYGVASSSPSNSSPPPPLTLSIQLAKCHSTPSNLLAEEVASLKKHANLSLDGFHPAIFRKFTVAILHVHLRVMQLLFRVKAKLLVETGNFCAFITNHRRLQT